MIERRALTRFLLGSAIATALVAPAAVIASTGAAAQPAPDDAPTDKAILFASDGMRPDLVDRYAREGVMPTMKDLIGRGVAGKNGLQQGFPPNTGVGWYTLGTGPGQASTAPRTTPSTAPARATSTTRQASPRRGLSRPITSRRRQSGPARRWHRSSGSGSEISCRRSKVRSWTSAASSPGAA